MRISRAAITLLLALGACHKAAGPADGSTPMTASEDKIDCRGAGETGFTKACTVERATEGDHVVLTLRHADGHFRRLVVGRDGRGVTGDGAERVGTTMLPSHEIEIAVAEDRYRLPAVPASGGPATTK